MKRAKLQAARYRKGLSQEALAEQMGVSRNAVSRWENGYAIPYPLYVGKLCTFFEVDDPATLDLFHAREEDQTLSSSLVSTNGHASTTQSDIFERVAAYGRPGESTSVLKQAKGVYPPASDISVSLLADMVQLPQTVVYEQAPDEHGVFLLSESGIVASPEPSVQMLSLTTARIDLPTWFGLQVNDLKAIGASWQGSPVPYQQQQASIHAELERWNSMADQDYRQTSEYLITRRTALATLATLSTRLLTRVQGGPLSAIVVEEFLRESTAAITASWELLNGDGLATVEYSLPKYLPLLTSLAHQPSKYQRQAAYLASQGCLLMNFVTYHRFRFQELLAYATQSVELAVISGDVNLQVKTLGWLGGAFELNGQAQMLLEKRQNAALHLKKVLQPLQSKVLSELAYAYAQNGLIEDAQRNLKEAQQLLPDTIGDLPCFISSDYGMLQLILEEGKTHLALSQHDPDHVLEHSLQAQTALAQLEKLPSTISVPKRTKIEIINQQAAAAIGTGNMEEFVSYLKAGVAGAKVLVSQKRKQEAIANWKAARARWSHEKRILELADILME